MRLFNKKMIAEFALNMNYGPEPDTISYLLKQGATIAEVQAKMDERIAGESYLNMTKSMMYMLGCCCPSCLFRTSGSAGR